MMFEHNAQDGSMWGGFYSRNMNQMDPMLSYKYKDLLNEAVPNPFYGVFPTSLSQAQESQFKGLPIMPGSIGTSSTVSLSQLLRPYPQYGDLNQQGWAGQRDHYYGLAFSATRPFSHGWTLLATYNYNIENHTQYYDDIDTYNDKLTMFDRGYPRHDLRVSGTYQLPFGKGRDYFNKVPWWVNEIIGGWSTSQIFYWHSGNLLNFPTSGMVCDPRENIPAGMWFNANCITTPEPYTIPTAPNYYEGIRGPHYWQLDSTAVKMFPIGERYNLEFRLEMYNMPNAFIPSDPNVCGVSQCGLGVAGVSTWVAGNSWGANYGREMQGSLRFHF